MEELLVGESEAKIFIESLLRHCFEQFYNNPTNTVIPIIEVKKLKYRKIKQFFQGHTIGNLQSMNLSTAA